MGGLWHCFTTDPTCSVIKFKSIQHLMLGKRHGPPIWKWFIAFVYPHYLKKGPSVIAFLLGGLRDSLHAEIPYVLFCRWNKLNIYWNLVCTIFFVPSLLSGSNSKGINNFLSAIPMHSMWIVPTIIVAWVAVFGLCLSISHTNAH